MLSTNIPVVDSEHGGAPQFVIDQEMMAPHIEGLLSMGIEQATIDRVIGIVRADVNARIEFYNCEDPSKLSEKLMMMGIAKYGPKTSWTGSIFWKTDRSGLLSWTIDQYSEGSGFGEEFSPISYH